MRITRLARRSVLAGALATAMISPAANAMTVSPALGNCGENYAQACFGAGQAVPVGLATLRVTFTCTAVSPAVVDRTGVGCFLVGLTDGLEYAHIGPLFTVGNQSTLAQVAVNVPFQAYKICVGAGYSTSNGGYAEVQNYTCLT